MLARNGPINDQYSGLCRYVRMRHRVVDLSTKSGEIIRRRDKLIVGNCNHELFPPLSKVLSNLIKKEETFSEKQAKSCTCNRASVCQENTPNLYGIVLISKGAISYFALASQEWINNKTMYLIISIGLFGLFTASSGDADGRAFSSSNIM